MKTARSFLFFLLCLFNVSETACFAQTPVQFSGLGYNLRIEKTGCTLTVSSAKSGSYTTHFQLWSAAFSTGEQINSSSQSLTCKQQPLPGHTGYLFTWKSDDLTVEVKVIKLKKGVELRPNVVSASRTLTEFSIPAKVQFPQKGFNRFISPTSGSDSVGIAFLPSFFATRSEESPAGWTPEMVGSGAYKAIYGSDLLMKPDQVKDTLLHATPEGSAILGEELAKQAEKVPTQVNRACAPGQSDIIVLDSDDGPFFSGSHLNGKGTLWRFGGLITPSSTAISLASVKAVLNGLLLKKTGKIGILLPVNGPVTGGWTTIPAATWRDLLKTVSKDRFHIITSSSAMVTALDVKEYAAILNPYGEWLPFTSKTKMKYVTDKIAGYVREGGDWFETGGYSFYAGLIPNPHFRFDCAYPPAFSDFFHIDSTSGGISLYRVAPDTNAAWAAAKDHSWLFMPGRLACGGDKFGGWCERPYTPYSLAPGEHILFPSVRIICGQDAYAALRLYCTENSFNRSLDIALTRPVLDKFKKSVLLNMNGTARQMVAAIDKLPVPTLLHFANYLHGGFDKQLPTHLPPNAGFGTEEDMAELFTTTHAKGHLIMPYTNGSWWCDHPRGPAFESAGNAAISVREDGTLYYEKYGQNDGWTMCFWHNASKEANRDIIRQFTRKYPVDILFQDQWGARGSIPDKNLTSPEIWAYSEGLLSQVRENAAKVPLSTENGWDRIIKTHVQLSGLTWQIVPTEYPPEWRRLLRDIYPPETWRIFPMIQAEAHGQCSLILHDLGQFVTNRQVIAWTLGLGFNMSYAVNARELEQPARLEWLRWLDRLQKSICARWTGVPLKSFSHARPGVTNDGVINTAYGDMRLVANLDTTAQNGLPPFGFRASAPGMLAGELNMENPAGYVWEYGSKQTELWVYSSPGHQIEIPVPTELHGKLTVTFDGEKPASLSITQSAISIICPNTQTVKALYHATVRRQK